MMADVGAPDLKALLGEATAMAITDAANTLALAVERLAETYAGDTRRGVEIAASFLRDMADTWQEAK